MRWVGWTHFEHIQSLNPHPNPNFNPQDLVVGMPGYSKSAVDYSSYPYNQPLYNDASGGYAALFMDLVCCVVNPKSVCEYRRPFDLRRALSLWH